jgi:hypothetical protein
MKQVLSSLMLVSPSLKQVLSLMQVSPSLKQVLSSLMQVSPSLKQVLSLMQVSSSLMQVLSSLMQVLSLHKVLQAELCWLEKKSEKMKMLTQRT